MHVHHLNCGTMRPRSSSLFATTKGALAPARLVCHCLLAELPTGLLLVDSGFGLADVRSPGRRLGAAFVALARPDLHPDETAVRQVKRLGFCPTDVRHIVLTHLDLDHAGGLADFPHARVYVSEGERRAALGRRTLLDRMRYRPLQWSHAPQWVTRANPGEPWLGFGGVQALDEGLSDILVVPLGGHTRDHRGVAVPTTDGWLLHCGDAYFARGELDRESPPCPAGLAAYQRLMAVDRSAWLGNRARLRALAHDRGSKIELVCTHDAAGIDPGPPPRAATAPILADRAATFLKNTGARVYSLRERVPRIREGSLSRSARSTRLRAEDEEGG